jgi:hypothetical protein
MRTIQDILFEEQRPPSLPIAVFINFEKYEGPSISNSESVKVVSIVPIKWTWKGKNKTVCLWLQVPICLVWAVIIYKSQGLTLEKAKIDFGDKEFAAGLSFAVVSLVRSLSDICFKGFTFERLQCIKNCQKIQERKLEKKRLLFLVTEE